MNTFANLTLPFNLSSLLFGPDLDEDNTSPEPKEDEGDEDKEENEAGVNKNDVEVLRRENKAQQVAPIEGDRDAEVAFEDITDGMERAVVEVFPESDFHGYNYWKIQLPEVLDEYC